LTAFRYVIRPAGSANRIVAAEVKKSMTGTLQGKTIIVTGAGGGIGRAASLVLANAGANLVVTDIAKEAGGATVDAVRSAGGTALFVQADLATENEVSAIVDRAVATYGRLDGAFNNAGLEQCALPLHELTTEQWERALRVDLTSVFWCIKYQVLAMMKAGSGSIVNTASSLGQVAIQNASEYITAKHGVIGLTRAAAAEYGSRGIRVNAVLPGIIRTPMISRLTEDERFSAFFEKLKDRHPIGRFGEPAEIGEAVKWLLSDAASFMNGAAMAVDGGYLAV
jgi:NAD(P)-dependent dehydrogenase (short-subunit alcohol dehydrogenase family)